MCVTKQQAIDYLGLKTPLSTQQDARLDIILNATCAIIEGLVGDVLSGPKEETFDWCDLKRDDCGNLQIRFTNLNVTSIDTIDGQPYTGVLGTDYIIRDPNKRVGVISNYTTINQTQTPFCQVNIGYTAGFAAYPDDLLYAQLLLVEGEWYKSEGKKIKSYRLRQRQVTFGGDAEGQANYLTFQNIINRYTIFDEFFIV